MRDLIVYINININNKKQKQKGDRHYDNEQHRAQFEALFVKATEGYAFHLKVCVY